METDKSAHPNWWGEKNFISVVGYKMLDLRWGCLLIGKHSC